MLAHKITDDLRIFREESTFRIHPVVAVLICCLDRFHDSILHRITLGIYSRIHKRLVDTRAELHQSAIFQPILSFGIGGDFILRTAFLLNSPDGIPKRPRYYAMITALINWAAVLSFLHHHFCTFDESFLACLQHPFAHFLQKLLRIDPAFTHLPPVPCIPE